MLGLVASVGGAVALEVRRIRARGGPEEAKRKEKELRDLLEATNQELAKAQKQNAAAESKAQQLAQEKASLEQKAAALNQQKEQLQQNTTKLVMTNIMLANKAKHLEDSSRALVAKQEDLQHQLEQLQRERQAELEASEATLAALKGQVTAVLNRYLSKDIELQAALQEMQALGIELVPVGSGDGGSNVMEFEPKFVLESPHRMQRLMNAAVGRGLQLPGHDGSDVPMLSFPMAMCKDPTTGMPRVALGWRQPQGAAAGLLGASDEHTVLDQHAGSNSSAAATTSSSSTLLTMEADSEAALTFSSSSSNKKQQQQGGGGGFSLGFGSIGRIGMRGSGGGGSSSKAAGKASSGKPTVVPSFIKADLDDDLPAFGASTALTTTR